MYQTPSGSSPKRGLLSGMTAKGDVAAAGKGRAMQEAASMGMETAQQNQQMAMQQMQDQSQQRQREAQIRGRQDDTDTQARIQAGGLDNRRQAFDIGRQFDYAALQRRQSLNLQQALLNNMAREF
jgi:hypothetical protein